MGSSGKISVNDGTINGIISCSSSSGISGGISGGISVGRITGKTSFGCGDIGACSNSDGICSRGLISGGISGCISSRMRSSNSDRGSIISNGGRIGSSDSMRVNGTPAGDFSSYVSSYLCTCF